MSTPKPFIYRFTVRRIHDGDTIYGDLDTGFGHWWHDIGARFYGINCPELKTAAGPPAREFLKTLVKPGDVLTAESAKWDRWDPDKYGNRIDAILFRSGDAKSLNDQMIEAGHAVKVDYK